VVGFRITDWLVLGGVVALIWWSLPAPGSSQPARLRLSGCESNLLASACRTPAPIPARATPAPVYRAASLGPDRDCAHFGTRAAAQAFYLSAGPGDPHRLDSDNDGLACELLP
jgi:hypothetical protein